MITKSIMEDEKLIELKQRYERVLVAESEWMIKINKSCEASVACPDDNTIFAFTEIKVSDVTDRATWNSVTDSIFNETLLLLG